MPRVFSAYINISLQTVELSSVKWKFDGFLIQALSDSNGTTVGQFVNPDDDWKPATCQHVNVSINIGTFLPINQQ